MTILVRPSRVEARKSAKKPKSYQAYTFPAPSLGWIATNNLSMSVPGAAYRLENWFPTATGAITRRGKQKYATLGAGALPTRSVFSYVSGNNKQMFAANDAFIYNITTIASPSNVYLATEDDDYIVTENDDYIGISSTDGLDVYPNTNGRWIVARFQASTGQEYLVGVNGTDKSFVYDGTAFFPQVDGGVTALDYDAETAAFTAGDTLTGGTSAATATIYRVVDNGTTGTLYLTGITGGPFQDNETITDGAGGSATANGAGAAIPGTNMSFPSGVALTTADLSYVWTFKNRMFFIQKETRDVWYLPVGQIAGELAKFPLGGEFPLGGYLVFGASWSQDVGDGLNAMCTFFSSEGEVAVYQGDNPGDAAAWSQVGVYRTGKPLGDRCHVQIGGDLVVATDVGEVPLSAALSRDYSQLAGASLSAPIEAEWPKEVQRRPGALWEATLWTDAQMLVVGLPGFDGQPDGFWVMNSRTGKWALFTNWTATCLHVFNGRLFFGSADGCVYEGNVGGSDDGEPYACTYVPVWDQMGVPGHKTMSMARAVFRSAQKVNERIADQTDYRMKLPAAPAATVPAKGSFWGTMIWGVDSWGVSPDAQVIDKWRMQFGTGEVHAPAVLITSASLTPLDIEIIRTDALFTVGDPVT